MSAFESVVEEAAIAWLQELGWTFITGPILAPDGVAPERSSYHSVILEGRLRRALARINHHLTPEAIDEVANRALRLDSPSIEENNVSFRRMIRRGIEVEVQKKVGIRGDIGWLIDQSPCSVTPWLPVISVTDAAMGDPIGVAHRSHQGVQWTISSASWPRLRR